MAEGGEPPIHKVCQNVAIGSGDEKDIVHCPLVVGYGSRAGRLEDVVASGGHQAVTSEGEIIAGSSIRMPTNMIMDLARMTPEEKAHRKRVLPLSHRAEHFISRGDYKRAIILLEDPCVFDYDFFLLKLMLAQSYLYMGKYMKGWNMIDSIDKSIVVSLGRNPDEVLAYANDYLHHRLYIRSIIVVRKASDMYKTLASTPDEALNGIKLCLKNAHSATEGMMMKADEVSREIGDYHGIECMRKILHDSSSLKNANPEERALTEAWSCNYIGASLQLVGKYKRSKKYLKRGVKIVIEQFRVDKLIYRVYGSLMLHLGTAYDNLGKFELKGDRCYTKAIQAKNKATDYPNEIEKQKDIESSEDVVKRANEENVVKRANERGST